MSIITKFRQLIVHIAEGVAGAKTITEKAVWQMIIADLEGLGPQISAISPTDGARYIGTLAPIIVGAGRPGRQLIAIIDAAASFLDGMTARTRQLIGDYIDAVMGAPDVVNPYTPIDALYLYCRRVVCFALANTLAGDYANPRKTAKIQGYLVDGAPIRYVNMINERATLHDYIAFTIAPHRCNRLKLVEMVVFINCTMADVQPDEEPDKLPPMSNEQRQMPPTPREEKKDNTVNAPEVNEVNEVDEIDNDAIAQARVLGKRARVGGTCPNGYSRIYELLDARHTARDLLTACRAHDLPSRRLKDEMIEELIDELGADALDNRILFNAK